MWDPEKNRPHQPHWERANQIQHEVNVACWLWCQETLGTQSLKVGLGLGKGRQGMYGDQDPELMRHFQKGPSWAAQSRTRWDSSK